ncbi:hypothetical protein ACQEVF_56640 [Nonomuraea polychroma]|uniref:hypothetical protein n=1 Tax=Nonomuraea polychroma TaxID=46176 RepID=UPI003D94C1D3
MVRIYDLSRLNDLKRLTDALALLIGKRISLLHANSLSRAYVTRGTVAVVYPVDPLGTAVRMTTSEGGPVTLGGTVVLRIPSWWVWIP